MEDSSGKALYKAVQDAVDSARSEGADYVYVMGHLGYVNEDAPYTYADVIANTNGIDVFLDGHSHDMEQVVMKNKDGKKPCVQPAAPNCRPSDTVNYPLKKDCWIPACGSGITARVPELLGVDNDISKAVGSAISDLNKALDEVIGKSTIELTVNEPDQTYDDGAPIRRVRRAETNLGDLCADAIRIQLDAEVGICGGANVRACIAKGDITYGKILEVFPFNNEMCVIAVTGQQILVALEWGSAKLPGEFGGFMQVSGLSYEIDVSVPSPCTKDEEGMFTGISGERRVRNVKVGGKALDPEATYTVAG